MKVARFKLKNINDILQWIRTEAQMVQWAGSVFTWPITHKQFRTHLSAASSEPPTLYPFGLYDRTKIIGYAELSNHLCNSNSAMLSRVLISPRRRKIGLGQFMVKQLVDFGFTELGLNRIGLGVFDFNKAAMKCYTQAGFVLEGTLRESARVGNTYWNCHLMSILRKDWQFQQMTPAKIPKGC